MTKINKIIVVLMLLLCVSTVYADDLANASTSVGLDLSDLGYFKIWFTDENGEAHPDIKDLEKKSGSDVGDYSYYANFFLHYETITKDSVKVNLSADGALKTSDASDSVDYYVSEFDSGVLVPVFGIKDTAIIKEYEEGTDITVSKDADNKASGTKLYSVQLAKDASGAKYEVYTADIIAKVVVL